MDEKKLNHRPHVGAEPVKAEPNQVREKTYKTPNPPKEVQDEETKLPEGTTRETAVDGMHEATDKVRRRV